jgi:hypothetical protein
MKHLTDLANYLSLRLEKLTLRQKALVEQHRKGTTRNAKLSLALQFEWVTAQIYEVEKFMDALMEAINLDRIEMDHRQMQDRRRKSRRQDEEAM